MKSAKHESTPATAVVGHLIGGERVAGGTRSGSIYNPATGRVVREVLLADRATVEQAIAAAAAAYPVWRQTPPVKRARIMFRFKALLEQNEDRIVALLTEEHGKVLHDARGELRRGMENVEYACGAPEFLKGEHSKNAGSALMRSARRERTLISAETPRSRFPARYRPVKRCPETGREPCA